MALSQWEAREKRDTLATELRGLQTLVRDGKATAGHLERVENVTAGIARLDEEIADMEARMEHIRELAKDPWHREEPGVRNMTTGEFETPGRKRVDNSPGAQHRDTALRAIESRSDVIGSEAGDRLTKLVEHDKFGLDNAYITAVSSPAYERAFSKKLTGIDGAEGVLDPDEAAAMQTVGQAMAMRAMAVGEGKTGGYAVPLTLDPSVMLTNDGAVNPLRELATVTSITTTKWQGVSSAGVTAVFTAEATEASDGAPELGAPEITPSKAQIWVPFSIEVGEDWSSLSAELTKLFGDAKATKEAEVFAVGKGSENIPQGITVGATKSPVETTTKEVFAIADVYALQEALPARWQAKATWLGANKVANSIHKFVAQGDASNAAIMADDRTSILGKPFREVSNMSTKTTTKKEKILAYGSVSDAFRVIDRVGMTVELVPLVLNAGKPTGQRGLYCHFRVGSKVIVPEAVRVLVVKE